ncbi:MAG: sulfatase-like hydrolase/transferase, partial [Verrucomicrobia bacterium]|nr:sulfatase-like hydrolase/transferase [Verrucomicrobiota bacterium]
MLRLALLFLLPPLCLFPCRAAESRAANIVFILADDLGWNGIGPYGNKDVSTPHLDRLA